MWVVRACSSRPIAPPRRCALRFHLQALSHAAAIDAGVKPEDIFMDAPLLVGVLPKNFRNKYYGKISLAEALKKSLTRWQFSQDKVGFDAVITTANRLGIGNQRPLAGTTRWQSGPMSRPCWT